MKITKFVSVLSAAFFASALFLSCGSTASLEDTSKPVKPAPVIEEDLGLEATPSSGGIKTVGAKLPPPPDRATEAPKYDFTENSLQIELEEMYYDGFAIIADSNASKSYALKLQDESSWAIAEINFPAGSYEGVVNVLAPDSEHSKFNVSINNDSYLVFGSEPPISKYELTTRSLVSFTLDQSATVTLKIQQNDLKNPANNGQNGMTIDYISFKKIK